VVAAEPTRQIYFALIFSELSKCLSRLPKFSIATTFRNLIVAENLHQDIVVLVRSRFGGTAVNVSVRQS
jgi:hypothetical protein